MARKKLSEEHKRKISQSLKGRRPKNLPVLIEKAEATRFKKGNKPWNKGRSLRDYPQMGFQTGNKNYLNNIKPFEKLGTKSKDSKWKRKLLKRDGFKCVECGEANRKLLQAHHVKKREECKPEELYDINNGEILCVFCHSKKSPKHKRKFIVSKYLKYERRKKVVIFAEIF